MQREHEITVAQMAAFFCFKHHKKKLPHLKLMKLLYLSDREMIRVHGYSISSDNPVSMPHGSVLSQTLDLMNGNIKCHKEGWETWVCDKADHEISLSSNKILDEKCDFEKTLHYISPAALDILKTVWKNFGHMNQWQIRDWTHEHCPEWHETKSSEPITFEAIAQAVGFSEETAQEIGQRIELNQSLQASIA